MRGTVRVSSHVHTTWQVFLPWRASAAHSPFQTFSPLTSSHRARWTELLRLNHSFSYSRSKGSYCDLTVRHCANINLRERSFSKGLTCFTVHRSSHRIVRLTPGGFSCAGTGTYRGHCSCSLDESLPTPSLSLRSSAPSDAAQSRLLLDNASAFAQGRRYTV